jgi:hypothetical protein
VRLSHRFSQSPSRKFASAREIVGSVVVPKTLTHTHSAIQKLLHRDETRRKRQSADPSFMGAPVFESPTERRRLRILNALFLALERCGGSPWTRGSDARELGVLIGDVLVSFKLDRIQTRGSSPSTCAPEGKGNSYDGLRLELERWSLSMAEPPSWADSKGVQLESILTEICVEMLVSAELLLRHGMQERYDDLVAERNRLLENARVIAEQEEQARVAGIEREKQRRLEQLLDEATMASGRGSACLRPRGS